MCCLLLRTSQDVANPNFGFCFLLCAHVIAGHTILCCRHKSPTFMASGRIWTERGSGVVDGAFRKSAFRQSAKWQPPRPMSWQETAAHSSADWHIPVQTGRKSSLRYRPACEGGVVVIFAYLCSFKTDCTLQLWRGYLDSKDCCAGAFSASRFMWILDRIIWTCEISAGRTISDLCLRIPCWDKSAVQDLWQEYAHQYPNTSSRRNVHHMKMHEEDATFKTFQSCVHGELVPTCFNSIRHRMWPDRHLAQWIQSTGNMGFGTSRSVTIWFVDGVTVVQVYLAIVGIAWWSKQRHSLGTSSYFLPTVHGSHSTSSAQAVCAKLKPVVVWNLGVLTLGYAWHHWNILECLTIPYPRAISMKILLIQHRSQYVARMVCADLCHWHSLCWFDFVCTMLPPCFPQSKPDGAGISMQYSGLIVAVCLPGSIDKAEHTFSVNSDDLLDMF